MGDQHVQLPDSQDLPAWGLYVREPFAMRIVSGLKSWEMRRASTTRRGQIGIVSQLGLVGTVHLHKMLGPFSISQLYGCVDKHRAPISLLSEYADGRRLYAWVMRSPVRFVEPIAVCRERGPTVWIPLRRIDSTD